MDIIEEKFKGKVGYLIAVCVAFNLAIVSFVFLVSYLAFYDSPEGTAEEFLARIGHGVFCKRR